ncbi:PHP domain-containing protein [Pseudonocardia sp. DSM 110487]|uniref:PHP domain-containing protein n=1 Tax=Pseudonocardia sp. DSM 110487 TaxID=2865833 RepID=UPI001C69EAB1|nr:PHP domain-containing protein [Pseudonocardia sp. DSM 110487]QYN34317.1 PHP domain-containing protein [Pseudonocardia sp. DSM 110487]
MTETRNAVADLRRIAFLLERAHESTYRVRAFRTAAAVLRRRDADEIARLVRTGELVRLKGVGEVTAKCVAESVRGEPPSYLLKLEAIEPTPLDTAAEALLEAIRGDCHSHTDASDGGSPLREMVETAQALGHDYLVITDHSPRLTVANGLSADRLRAQLEDIAELNAELTGFRVLTGIEVDINEDGSLDQDEELLAQLDVVVASVHSKLKMPAVEMTERMLTAIANPHVDVLGHCTGRMVAGNRKRPGSQFDAGAVFDACAEYGVAVEVNSRPERLDPPRPLLRKALAAGCQFTIDTDAHAPGQLDWLRNGCERAAECEVPADRVLNTWPLERLLTRTRG